MVIINFIFFIIITLNYNIQALFIPNSAIPPLDVPVWSLSTINQDGSSNMNIMTYASPVSTMKPNPIWSLSLYRSTLSYENFNRERVGLLQMLTQEHIGLVELLGKTSGRNINKVNSMMSLGYLFESFDMGNNRQLLALQNCEFVVRLKGNELNFAAGDHQVFLCEAQNCIIKSSNEGESKSSRLTSGKLRELGLL